MTRAPALTLDWVCAEPLAAVLPSPAPRSADALLTALGAGWDSAQAPPHGIVERAMQAALLDAVRGIVAQLRRAAAERDPAVRELLELREAGWTPVLLPGYGLPPPSGSPRALAPDQPLDPARIPSVERRPDGLRVVEWTPAELAARLADARSLPPTALDARGAIWILPAEADRAGSVAPADRLNRRGCERWRAAGERVAALEGALADFDRALELDPKHASAYNNRACVRAELGDLPAALTDLRRAVHFQPGLAPARENAKLLSRVAAHSGLAPAGAHTTIASVLEGAAPRAAFVERLVAFLEREVPVSGRNTSARADAIQEVVLRVLEASQRQDVPPEHALRRLRRTSTRGWVRSLLPRFRARGGQPSDRPAPTRHPSEGREQTQLRLVETLERARQCVLQRSQPATRWRRRIVWDVYVGGLLQGLALTRGEVLAAVRDLGVSKRRATDTQLEHDLKLIARTLRDRRGV